MTLRDLTGSLDKNIIKLDNSSNRKTGEGKAIFASPFQFSEEGRRCRLPSSFIYEK